MTLVSHQAFRERLENLLPSGKWKEPARRSPSRRPLCYYNEGRRAKNPGGIDAVQSMELKLQEKIGKPTKVVAHADVHPIPTRKTCIDTQTTRREPDHPSYTQSQAASPHPYLERPLSQIQDELARFLKERPPGILIVTTAEVE
ncbi:hypothetical protein PM082_007045 [Marasmius tenuissimus]|nr:hypothetical protein PM082_007045 [Marasmius tenuissimus]